MNKNIEPKMCPFCGSERIIIKKQTITHYDVGEDNVKVWAVCLNCGHRGLSAFGRLSERESKEAAIKLWNEVRN